MTDLINLMNDLLWGSILVYLLVGVGSTSPFDWDSFNSAISAHVLCSKEQS
ncbi:sodium/alanine symporter [Vibrio sp. JCM 19052]|nr:sodium/alanine symporter [Vibrio sp. JCM 19052]